MALQVWNGDFRDLWDVMLQKWAPHCHYYYLICGDVVESNDIKRKYFTWDYVTQISFSLMQTITSQLLKIETIAS